MRIRKMHGIVMLVLGVIAMAFSVYIRKQVEEGEGRISRAQKTVNQSRGLFNLSPVTKGIGDAVTGGAQKKIDKGILQVQHYNDLAGWLQIGGIIFIIAGAGIAIFAKKK